jgi:[acyl-carrier-protein] S-malonyltransferase
MKIAGFFPGQGSQFVGMLEGLADNAIVKQVFDEASDAVGQDLWALSANGPLSELSSTRNTQPTLLAASVALYRVWKSETGIAIDIAAGHSLGEFSAYVCAETMSLVEATKLVRQRADAMQSCVPREASAMSAVIGVSGGTVAQICKDCRALGWKVEAVNFNEPNQTVIAGLSAAVAEAAQRCEIQGATHVIPLAVSAPFHTSLLQPAGEVLRSELSKLAILNPLFPVVNGIDGNIRETRREIIEALARQAYSPILWIACMQTVVNYKVDIAFEFGPGKALAGFCRRAKHSIRVLPVNDMRTIDIAVRLLEEARSVATN